MSTSSPSTTTPDEPIVVHIEARRGPAWCRSCGVRAQVKDRPCVELVDLPCFGRPSRLVWRKHRWHCPEPACPAGSWTIIDTRIAPPRMALTDRAGRWVVKQVGDLGRTVNEIAVELGCDWHTINDAVLAYGEALLEADTERVGAVDALGLDETLFNRTGDSQLTVRGSGEQRRTQRVSRDADDPLERPRNRRRRPMLGSRWR